jgi:hypothetical protein
MNDEMFFSRLLRVENGSVFTSSISIDYLEDKRVAMEKIKPSSL